MVWLANGVGFVLLMFLGALASPTLSHSVDIAELRGDRGAGAAAGGSGMNKTYLGDGVYADTEDGMLKLTTENGYGASNTIYLEPEVIDALIRYVNTARGASSAPPKSPEALGI